MTVALIIAGYVIGWMACGWMFTVVWLDREVRNRGRYESAEESADSWRTFYIGSGFGAALIWPIALPIFLTWFVLAGGLGARLFRTPIEREDAARRELEQLRKQAREYGLPMPKADQ